MKNQFHFERHLNEFKEGNNRKIVIRLKQQNI